MEASSKQIDWHLEILPREARKALDFLSTQKWLKGSHWYLAGGTALALQVGHRIDKIILRLKTQYPAVTHNYHHILKSLVYFSDAENDPMPQLLLKVSWAEVKKFFQREIPEITNKIIKL